MLECSQCSYWSTTGCALGKYGAASEEPACNSFLKKKDIPYHQVNNPIQIQSSVVANSKGYLDTELLTVLYQDGTIMQGRRFAGPGEHAWLEITLPPSDESTKDLEAQQQINAEHEELVKERAERKSDFVQFCVDCQNYNADTPSVFGGQACSAFAQKEEEDDLEHETCGICNGSNGRCTCDKLNLR